MGVGLHVLRTYQFNRQGWKNFLPSNLDENLIINNSMLKMSIELGWWELPWPFGVWICHSLIWPPTLSSSWINNLSSFLSCYSKFSPFGLMNPSRSAWPLWGIEQNKLLTMYQSIRMKRRHSGYVEHQEFVLTSYDLYQRIAKGYEHIKR